MGEEKPDEELMGKRKSSPRLSTASLDADDIRLSGCREIIHGEPKNHFDVASCALFVKGMYGTIGGE